MSDEDKKNIEEMKEPENEAAKLQADCAEYKAGWQRAVADYKNLQKEVAEMRAQWVKMSEEQILQDFIPVYENFKKAFNVENGEIDENVENGDMLKRWKSWKQGIGYIMKQFADILKSYQVEEIKTAGEKFDPRLHEAISEEEAKGQESGVVLKEVEGGYKRGEKVIKPARVIISK